MCIRDRLNGGAPTTEAGKTEIMGKAKAIAQQMALFARSKNAEPQLPACSLGTRRWTTANILSICHAPPICPLRTATA